MILLIDNYDSFVYNLARYFGILGHERMVCRNDEITLAEIQELNPSHIILSPGPCTPNEAGVSLKVVQEFAGKIPILGVCLGHQVIGQAFGAKIVKANQPMHGMSSAIFHHQTGIFQGIKSPFTVGRYHSLIVSREEFPESSLQVTAWSETGEIMAIAHSQFPIWGVQFHPESVLTEHGLRLLNNFLYAKACNQILRSSISSILT